MNLRVFVATCAGLLMPLGALSQPQQASPNPYMDLNKRVQEKLQQRGFYGGPISGEFGSNTQAALAQFQLSVPMPASGQLDDSTLAALGVEPGAEASAGASRDPSGGAREGGTVEASAPTTGANGK